MVDRELHRSAERAQDQPFRRVVGGHLELTVHLAPEQAPLLGDARALRQRAVRVGLNRARLPLGKPLDVAQERENVLGRSRDLDVKLDPDHEVATR